jgi:hypothetical protein
MIQSARPLRTAILLLLVIFMLPACAARKSVKVLKQKVPAGSNIVVIIDSPSNIQNVVLSRFMSRDYRVKAFSAADLYTMKDVFDIRDFKKIAYNSDLKDAGSLLAMQKTFDNIYKLHVYNYELSKAESLGEMKEKYNVKYLILLELRDWEHVSWGRAIDLATYELVWVENYATRYNDTLESVVDHFLESISGS